MAKKVFFVTLGCKVNQYDSQAMLEQFQKHDYELSSDPAMADVVVVNTCTVTGTGDKKSMQMARRYHHSGSELVLAGCLAQRKAEQLRSTGARLIIGNQHRARVVELLEEAIREDKQIVAVEGVQGIPFENLSIHSHEGFSRAVMKIQEGCDNRCTYCIIPSVRGSIRSRKIEEIKQEAKALAEAGFQELVLTGIHLTSYGRDLAEHPSLAEAVKIVAETEGIRRVRLGSLEPRVATEAFAGALSQIKSFCPQFHLALQSGSDSVLRRMKRSYNTEQFMSAVERLRRYWTDCAFTTDVIVGFPGETDEEFEETLAFCQKVGFARLHVFPFSPREGTPAASMSGQVPIQVKSDRVGRLIELGKQLANQYHMGFLGKTTEVLFEQEEADGFLSGYTPEYILVKAVGAKPAAVQRVLLKGITEDGMMGEILDCKDQ